MGRIMDYVTWRGDLSFNQVPFNAIDAAIFSQLSIFDFDNIVPSEGEGRSIKDVFELYLGKGYKLSEPVTFLMSNKQHYLFEALAKSDRYKDLKLGNYRRIHNQLYPCQFEAMTIELDDLMLISFGGTDDTIVGWHEDFELLYLEEIPAHKYGKEYLEEILKITDKDIVLLGHSKGANISMEVLLGVSHETFDRVKRVYCFDGPGISQKEYEQALLDGRINKITAYIPYKSTIGRLFDHCEEYKIVECTANLAYQHDLLTWHVYQNDFIYKDHLSTDSIYLDKHLKMIINEMTQDEKKAFVSSLFNLMYTTGSKTLTELYKNKTKFVANMLRIKKDDKNILNKIFMQKILKDQRIRRIFIALFREFNNRD